MIPVDGRLLAVGAAVLGLTFTWLHGRAAQRRRRHRPQHTARLLPRGRPLTAGPGEVSLVSYNILCDKYATPGRLPHVFAQYLDPAYRWQRLLSELEAFGSDLIALQEVTVDRWHDLKAFMASLGYAAVVQIKAAASGNAFMLALFFKHDKLRLMWREERSRVLLAAFECVAAGPAEGQVLWVANVHLEACPYRPNDRVNQLKNALQRLAAHFGTTEEAEAADVIICGDFNCVHQDSPCWLLRRGRLERNRTDAICPMVPTTKESIAHPFALYEAYEDSGFRQPFTRKVGPQHDVLDYIWYSRHMGVSGVLRPLQQELRQAVDKCFLPNRWHPSDHLPIGAVLKLTPAAPAAEVEEAAAAWAAPEPAGCSDSLHGAIGGGGSSGGSGSLGTSRGGAPSRLLV